MEIKKILEVSYVSKYLFCLCMVISMNLLADTQTQITASKVVEAISGKTIKETNRDIIIFQDSYAVRDEDNIIGLSEDILMIGDYKFSLLNRDQLKLISIEKGLDKLSQSKLRVVESGSGRYKFITGSVLVQFNDMPDLESFAEEYNLVSDTALPSLESPESKSFAEEYDLVSDNLIATKDFSSMGFNLFEIKDISKIESLVEILRNDPRVSLVEYDFLDPQIQAR
tara:strand:+ start:2491 stop:3168 length:678 start_codon:yes stop_codon:yes gene_type:complete